MPYVHGLQGHINSSKYIIDKTITAVIRTYLCVLGLFYWFQNQIRVLENDFAEPVCMDIFKKPTLKKKKPSRKAASFMLVFRLAYSSTPKTEVIFSCEILVNF
jgi:hypothetical protein